MPLYTILYIKGCGFYILSIWKLGFFNKNLPSYSLTLDVSFSQLSIYLSSLSKMATGASEDFLKLVAHRRSNYTLSAETTIPDAKIVEIVQTAVKYAPSTYNVQSARAVVLFRDNHQRFWEIVAKHVAQLPVDEGTRAYLTSRINGFKAAYGTVLWFEDQATLDALGTKHATVQPLLGECKCLT